MSKMICQNSANIVEFIVNLHRHVEYVVLCQFSQRISMYSICQLQFIFSIFITMKRVNRPSELPLHSLAWFFSSTFMQQRINYLLRKRTLTHIYIHAYILFAFVGVAVSNSYCIILSSFLPVHFIQKIAKAMKHKRKVEERNILL